MHLLKKVVAILLGPLVPPSDLAPGVLCLLPLPCYTSMFKTKCLLMVRGLTIV